MSEHNSKIPVLDVKLSGPTTYPEWVVSLENYLDLLPAGETHRVWDVVTGEFPRPTEVCKKGSADEAEKRWKDLRIWKDANSVALLTMRKNAEEDVRARIGGITTAKKAYEELKNAFEGKTVMEYWALLSSITNQPFEDRTTTIDEHIIVYERVWNTFASIMGRATLADNDYFGVGLKNLSISVPAKIEFLLRSLPPFYSNTVENIRSKEYDSYDTVVRRLKEYIPMRQKGKKNGNGTVADPVVLKTQWANADNGKKCQYCIKVKNWRGIGHEESECRTKKREQGKSEAKAAEVEEGTEFVKMIRTAKSASTDNRFEYDTAASIHTTSLYHRLKNPRKIYKTIKAHDGSIAIATAIGDIELTSNGVTTSLRDVHYAPQFSNLVSGQVWESWKLGKEGLWIRGEKIFIFDENESKLMIEEDSWEVRKSTSVNIKEAHERYGHISYDTLSLLPEFQGVAYTKPHPACEACEQGKSTKPAAYKQLQSIRTTRILQRIHADIVGPFKPEAQGHRYALVIMDDFSRYCVVVTLKAKSNAGEALLRVIKQLEATTGKRVSQIQADWGGEFQNKDLEEELAQRGITLKETVPHHSETNAAIGRAIRTIVTMGRTILLATNGAVPKDSWPDALKFAAYTKNRVPHSALPDKKSPLEILDPTINAMAERSNLRPYGELVIVHDYGVKDKLAPRCHRGRIIGYTSTHGVYWTISQNQRRALVKDPKPVVEEVEIGIPTTGGGAGTTPSGSTRIIEISEGAYEGELEGFEEPIPPSTCEPQKWHRKTVAEYTALCGTRSSTGNRQPTWKAADEQAKAVGTDPDHPTDQQARSGPHQAEWAEARRKERAQLQKYGVYTVVRKEDIPEGTTPVDTKWVYVIKRKADGSIEKFKGRKVGRGFTQQYGVNYDETSAQTMRAETMKILMVVALRKGWKIRQWDVVGAYLQAPLQHTIYVTDIDENGETEYWKLHKALYGLKQGGHLWYDMLTDIMGKAEYRRCIGDEGVFVSTTRKAIIGTWVDDLVGIAPNDTDLNLLEEEVEKYVELEHCGRPSKLLGMECHWDNEIGGGLVLTQTTLIENLAAAHGVTGVKHSVPINPENYTADETEPCDQKEFQRIVGGLLYIAKTTRPEISIHMNLLGRRTAAPSMTNLQTAREICRYLLSTKSEGLSLKAGEEGVKVYADASYGGEQARSQTGVLMLVNEQPILWYSRRQDTVSLSITEAEYIAASEGAKDAAWVRQLLKEWDLAIRPPSLYMDNEAAAKLTKNHSYHRRTRHIDHKWHYVRQEANSGNLKIKGINGKHQLADPLTKLTPMTTMSLWKSTIGICGPNLKS